MIRKWLVGRRRLAIQGKTYAVAGQQYRLSHISPDQLDGLMGVMEQANSDLTSGKRNVVRSLMSADLLSLAVAIVLLPVAVQTDADRIKHLKSRDVSALADTIKYGISVDTMVEVINDFFTCTLTSSQLQILTARLSTLEKSSQTLSTLFVFLLAAISGDEKRSDTPQTSDGSSHT